MNRILADLTIGKRIILSFSLLILLFLGGMITVELNGIPGTAIQGKSASFRAKTLSDLELASGLLGERIASWFRERRTDVAWLTESPLFRQATEGSDSLSNSRIAGELRKFAQRHPGIDSAMLLDPVAGKIRASSGLIPSARTATDIGISPDKFSRFITPGYKETVEIILDSDKKLHLRIIRQVFSRDSSQKIIGILVAESNLDETLAPLISSVRNKIISHDWECVVFTKVGEEAVQYHVSKSGIKQQTAHLPDTPITAPIQRVLSGVEGPYEGPDQFGTQVLAFYRQIKIASGTSLGLIVKIPSETALKPARDDLLRQLLLWFALFGTGFVLSLFLTKQIVRPINDLASVARRIEAGDLTARAIEGDQTEAGQLASVFNGMIAKVQYWQEELEAQVENRTHDLKSAKERLEKQNDELLSAEEMLRESRTMLCQVLDTVPQSIFWKDTDGRYLGCNRVFAAAAGLDNPARIVGKTDFDLPWPREEAEAYRADDREVLRSSRPKLHIIEQLQQADGTRLWIDTSKAPLLDANGLAFAVLGIYDDITARKCAEEEKLKLESQLQQAQKLESVGRLAGGVAHDFNNMLSVILGHAELGLMNLDSAHPVCANLQEISKAAERSANLTRQLLAFAREQPISPKLIDLNETAAGMLKMLQRLIGEDIHLRWQPAPGLCRINIDPSQIDQILANLCVNARDAIENTGRIIIETGICSIDADYCAANPEASPGEYVRLVVSDDGKGMDRETQSRIFEPFYTTKERGKGTGLGLATVYGVVKQNNGFINIYSEPDKGTTFSIYLPRVKEDNDLKQPETDAQAVLQGQETILLVEDEAAILNMTAIMLEKQGYSVLRADTPGRALELAREHQGTIHLLMTDVIMPEMNGRDLAKNILALYPDVKRLFMSGYTADVIAHHGVLDEGVHFIQKPFSLPAMTAQVREVLDRG